jgi:tetratricopeptide (TPR) repeat protein
MSENSNSILRIFLSSTAIDMQEHRNKVSDAILRLGAIPVAMETFGAMPKEPAEACKIKVRESDALVVMLAHRYGWVPLKEEGGDDKKNITWIEVETAIENNMPVFAYLVDKNFGWTQPKEQDLLNNAKNEKEELAIVKNVRALNEFKSFLEGKAGLTRDIFTTPEDLAYKVATGLSNWIIQSKPSVKTSVSKKPEFVFRVVHPLQQAPHFRGRKQLLDDLQKWWQEPVTPDRVCSLVAIGGIGKTATVERFLDRIAKEKLSGSVLVWSFYEEPNTDAFLKEACIVFIGEQPESVNGRLGRLQSALAAENSQHLLVLDGLERIQSEGTGGMGHAKGDLEDHRLKHLLRSIAFGLGRTRALITSRFKLMDLAQWEGAGYRSFPLDALDNETAVAVLKAWEVKGSDEKLSQIAESVGRHALSVSVLGSYLYHYCGCDPDCVKDFKLDEISPDEPQAAKLGRILAGYAKNLPPQERDLLIRLSVFLKGVSIDILVYLIEAGGKIAGAMIGVDQNKLLLIAERLRKQGLVYSYNKGDSIIYTAHPFLREYFRALLGVKPEDIHEAVRGKLSIGLDAKPTNKPRDAEILDKYEKLIEHSILSGHFQEANDLFDNVMGGIPGHLFHIIGDFGRIIRIISLFSTDGTPQCFTDQLSDEYKSSLINDWGLAANAQGDLKTADSCFNICIELDRKNNNLIALAQILQNSAGIAMERGLFFSAKKLLEESLNHINKQDADNATVKYTKRYDNGFFASTLHALGEISQATHHFVKATEILGQPLFSIDGIYEAEHLYAVGEKAKALKQTNINLMDCEKNSWLRAANMCHYLLGILSLPESVSKARGHLQKVREWTEKSGHMECIIRSHILALEIAYCSKDYPIALSEAKTGLNHAEGCGYGKFTIDILLLLSKINCAIPDYSAALGFARKALDKSQHPDCGYAWGEANGLYLCGLCHKNLGEPELAKMRLEAALKIQEKVQHPEKHETIKLLEGLAGNR